MRSTFELLLDHGALFGNEAAVVGHAAEAGLLVVLQRVGDGVDPDGLGVAVDLALPDGHCQGDVLQLQVLRLRDLLLRLVRHQPGLCVLVLDLLVRRRGSVDPLVHWV